MYSTARQQKFNFCPRAFYFRYQNLEEVEISPEVKTEILEINSSESLKMSKHFLLSEMVKECFYSESITAFHLKKLIYRKANKFSLEQNELEGFVLNVEAFKESELFLHTRPSLVCQIHLEEFPSLKIGDVEVSGQVHLAWIEGQGKFNLLRISKDREADLSFLVLYAMKKYQVLSEKLNIGILNPCNWQVSWQQINWHSVSELQEQALSFEKSEQFSDYPQTRNISHCDICEYGEVCYKYSSDLDLL